MNKSKKSDPKKILVRNTELSVPKTKLVIEEKQKISEKSKKEEPKVPKTKPQAQTKFHKPELNSALKISGKINEIENKKIQKSGKSSDVALCDKMTRKVNFPTDKRIYKDLVPLQVPARSPPVLSARDPLPQKDKEPQLSTYAEYPKMQEYVYTPSVKSEKDFTLPQVDNLRLYRIIQMNSEHYDFMK